MITNGVTTLTFGLGNIDGLEPAEQAELSELRTQLAAKVGRQHLRQMYYDAKQGLKSLGIAIPPSMEDIDTVLGWPAKAVDQLSIRTMLDGFVTESGEDLGIAEIWDDNDMEIEAPQVHTSTFLHACSFIAVTRGDVGSGEPAVLISPRSGMTSTGIWDPRRRRLRSALAITDTTKSGLTSGMIMYLPDRIVTIKKSGTEWTVERVPHALGRPPVIPMVHQPRLDRPFGRSRVSRPVMTITDNGLRTVVRSEVTAEFFSGPQRYAMGASGDDFVDGEGNKVGEWLSIIGRVWAIGRNADGEAPEVGQFPQVSMQPHGEHLRMYAAQFSGETGVPLSSLGVSHDNPTSAEAIFAANLGLVEEARISNRVLGHAWRRVAQLAWMVQENTTVLSDSARGIHAHFADPSLTTPAAAADAVTKTVGTLPWLAETPIPLEQLGWDRATVDRAMQYKRRAEGRQAITALANLNLQQEPQDEPQQDEQPDDGDEG